MRFTVACAQFAPLKAEVGANLDAIAAIVRQCEAESVDLVLCPETSTSGYFLEGGVIEAALSREELLSQLVTRLDGQLTRPIDIALGFYERADGSLYNSAAYLELRPDGGTIRAVYRKFFLPTYGVFDEERFVSRGRDLTVFDTRFGRFALLICEDIWHSVMPTLCAVRGAQVILVPAASPARGFGGDQIENHDRYERLFRAVGEEHSVYVLNAQLVGFEGGKGFIGGSMLIGPDGTTVAKAPLAEPNLLVAEVDLDRVTIARAQSPLLNDLQGAWEEVRRLVGQTDTI
ncbi:MAG: nitrilase-related carbon-nitrogen hydrolase [Fimbriimonadaceae bacterium]|nr:nitrilase-related carbon-nitrogen hydrolase [Fimbriimonadaceae bacterium]